jgi:hypothetical protein
VPPLLSRNFPVSGSPVQSTIHHGGMNACITPECDLILNLTA